MNRPDELLRSAREQVPVLLRQAMNRLQKRLPAPPPGPQIMTPATLLEQEPEQPAEGAPLTVTVLSGRAEIERGLPVAEWEALAAQALEPNPFYEPWLALPALRELPGGERVLFVLVHAPHPSGKKGARLLCGLFPLEAGSLGGGLPLQVTSLWQHPYCFFSAPLVRADGAAETLAAFLDWTAAAPRRLMRLDNFPGEGALRHLLLGELNRRGWTHSMIRAHTRAMFRPASSALESQALISGKRRRGLRRQRTRLSEQGAVTFRALAPGEDCAEWLTRFLELEARGWKGKAGTALSCHPAHERFFRAMSTKAHAGGRLLMVALELDGRPIAIKHNVFSGGHGAAFKTAFDEEFGRFSPGVLLELESIERFHARPGLLSVDSCADEDRFMVNELWHARREIHSLLFATDAGAALAVSIVPLVRYFRQLSEGGLKRMDLSGAATRALSRARP